MNSGADWTPNARGWAALCRRAARHRTALYRSDCDDGPKRYFTVTGTVVRRVPDLDGLEAMLDHADAAELGRRDDASGCELERKRGTVLARSEIQHQAGLE